MVEQLEHNYPYCIEGPQNVSLLPGEIENWWDPDTEESYKTRAQCMIDQYSSYNATQVCNLNCSFKLPALCANPN